MQKLNITRDKLAEFIPDHNTIRQIELLLQIVNTIEEPVVVTIEDTTDIIDLFPIASGNSGRRIYRRTGSGSGTFTLNTQNSEELILLGGASVSSIVLSGEETLEVYIAEGKLWVLSN